VWSEFVANLTKHNKYVKIQPPAAQEDIQLLKSKYGNIPSELTDFLLELNGDNDCMLSVARIIETNDFMRSSAFACFMPIENLLFFAGNGCGDYYGYAISGDGIESRRIFMWHHETDDRVYVANCLKDAIALAYT
jgi:hypothetical protein